MNIESVSWFTCTSQNRLPGIEFSVEFQLSLICVYNAFAKNISSSYPLRIGLSAYQPALVKNQTIDLNDEWQHAFLLVVTLGLYS